MTVIWRCHIGVDEVNEEVARGGAFLEPYLEPVDAFVFTRAAYVPPLAAGRYTALIAPSIDPLTPKNEELDEETTLAILVHTGLLVGQASANPITFLGQDGSPRRVDRRAEVVRWGQAPRWDTPLVVVVSRWDPLKDPIGAMRGFASLVEVTAPAGAELVLAGPETSGVADDPEPARVLEQTVAAWRELPEPVRDRVHIASLPTADVEENAAIVNALQHHARVVVQKSLQEGFGLTVSEAMWKSRAVLASAVGGIQDQIVGGEHGLLLDDPDRPRRVRREAAPPARGPRARRSPRRQRQGARPRALPRRASPRRVRRPPAAPRRLARSLPAAHGPHERAEPASPALCCLEGASPPSGRRAGGRSGPPRCYPALPARSSTGT